MAFLRFGRSVGWWLRDSRCVLKLRSIPNAGHSSYSMVVFPSTLNVSPQVALAAAWWFCAEQPLHPPVPCAMLSGGCAGLYGHVERIEHIRVSGVTAVPGLSFFFLQTLSCSLRIAAPAGTRTCLFSHRFEKRQLWVIVVTFFILTFQGNRGERVYIFICTIFNNQSLYWGRGGGWF